MSKILFFGNKRAEAYENLVKMAMEGVDTEMLTSVEHFKCKIKGKVDLVVVISFSEGELNKEESVVKILTDDEKIPLLFAINEINTFDNLSGKGVDKKNISFSDGLTLDFEKLSGKIRSLLKKTI